MWARAINFSALLVFTLSLSGGQILFKYVGLRVQGLGARDAIIAALSSPALYAALTLYGSATVLWIWILSRVPLTEAYPWVALGMVIVPMVGVLMFGERVTPLFWCGVALIVAGVFVTQHGLNG